MKTWTTAVAALAALLAAAAGGAQDPGGPRPGRSAVSPVPAPPQAKSEEEKKILDVILDLDKNQRRGMMNVPMEDGRLLRLLVESTGAKHVVEIGTSNGFSGLWICMGLKATGGKLTTHEIDAGRAALARENFRKAGVDSIVTLVEGDAHKEVGKLEGPIDALFLDADKEGYIDYLKQLLPKVRPGGLLLAHNVTSHGRDMKEYLEAITADPALETLYVNRHMSGMSVTLKKH
jgi:predicted O-methyltransferase YrrM